jgi:hypothetical protein
MLGQIRSRIEKLPENGIKIERYSDAFSIRLSLDFSEKAVAPARSGFGFVDGFLGRMPDFRAGIETVKRNADDDILIKNMGFAFGEALRSIYEKNSKKETGTAIRTEGKNMCMFAINARKQFGEANLQIIGKPGFDASHFFSFFDGFAQGMASEVNAVVKVSEKSSKSAHLEFVAKAFADSLRQLM